MCQNGVMRLFAIAYVAILAALAIGGTAGGVLLYRSSGPDDQAEAAATKHAFDFLSWEVEHFPRKWIYRIRHLFDDSPASVEELVLRRYFEAEGDRSDSDAAIEDIIEGRITAVLEEQDLAFEPPLFADLGLVFPPVDIDLAASPRVLAVSPRDRIELRDSYLLEPGLSAEEFEAIEREAELENGPASGTSAVVVGTGGVATYPAVVSSGSTYERVIDTAFHEWIHQYLAFYPLGRSYFSGSDLRTLNETAANLAGAALAGEYFKRYPHLQAMDAPAPAATPAPPAEPAFDFTKAMRELRATVEQMLARGEITEAEGLMETKRQELAERGYFIRKLNQAYFAFHGSYADTPGSIDPIGPKMQKLLAAAGSPGEFVKLAAGITSRSELDRVLAEAE